MAGADSGRGGPTTWSPTIISPIRKITGVKSFSPRGPGTGGKIARVES